MPRSCCVPNCKSNYPKEIKKGKKYVSSFAFPKDEELRKKWIAAVNRKNNFIPSKHSAVCSKHFLESEISTIDRMVRPDGSILTCPRIIPKLDPSAIPTIFPNRPVTPGLDIPELITDIKEEVLEDFENTSIDVIKHEVLSHDEEIGIHEAYTRDSDNLKTIKDLDIKKEYDNEMYIKEADEEHCTFLEITKTEIKNLHKISEKSRRNNTLRQTPSRPDLKDLKQKKKVTHKNV